MINELKTVQYENGKLIILDTSKLPNEVEYIEIGNVQECYDAISKLKVRGAPAIGVAGAYGLTVVSNSISTNSAEIYFKEISNAANYLKSSRPTAVNLSWAIDRLLSVIKNNNTLTVSEIKRLVQKEAVVIQQEDIEMCKVIGKNGLSLLKDGMGVLTHCNAGLLATSKYGTATAPLYMAHQMGMKIKVFADETRPLLQGSRLTAYELSNAGIDVTLICDNMAGFVMSQGLINAVIVGADRIASNGDTANKIGTYSVAVCAKYHNIPLYVAAPSSTIDMSIQSGRSIVIENRDPDEITCGFGKRTAPEGISVYNPAFDITPNCLITAFVTEKGIITPKYDSKFSKLFS